MKHNIKIQSAKPVQLTSLKVITQILFLDALKPLTKKDGLVLMFQLLLFKTKWLKTIIQKLSHTTLPQPSTMIT